MNPEDKPNLTFSNDDMRLVRDVLLGITDGTNAQLAADKIERAENIGEMLDEHINDGVIISFGHKDET